MGWGNNCGVYTINITLEGGNLTGNGGSATSMSNGVYANGVVTVRGDGYLNATVAATVCSLLILLWQMRFC